MRGSLGPFDDSSRQSSKSVIDERELNLRVFR